MKKTFKKLVCSLSAAALLFTCAGCDASDILGKLSFTPALSKDAVLMKLTEYVAGRTPTAADVTIDMLLHGDRGTVAVSVDGSAMTDETASYGEGELSFTANGNTTTDHAQAYTLAENGKLVTFTHLDSADLWFKTEAPLPEIQAAPVTPVAAEDAALTIPDAYRFLLLEEGLQTINDKRVYQLTGSLDGEDFLSALEQSAILDTLSPRLQALSPAATVDLKTLDFSALSADVDVYVAKSDGRPVEITVSLHGVNLLLKDLLPMLPNQVTASLNGHISVESIRVTFSNISFDGVTVPTIPEEGRILALQESFRPDQGDGSYVLLQYPDAVKITPKKTFTTSELTPYYATFRNEDNTRAIHCELYRDMTAEDFIALVENGMIPAMEQEELEPVSAKEDAIGDYQIHSITTNGVNVYIACRNVGNSLLGIYVEDSTGKPIHSVLPDILERIEDWNVEY